MSLNGFVAVAAVLSYYIASSLDPALLNYHVCWLGFLGVVVNHLSRTMAAKAKSSLHGSTRRGILT